MLAMILGLVAQACATGALQPQGACDGSASAPDQSTNSIVYDAVFKPLRGYEAAYADLGAAGPYYPDRAAREGRWGGAIIDCRVRAGGELADCRTTLENPRGLGFADAALLMASRGRITVTPDAPVGQIVRVRVMFDPRVKAKVEH
jgi:hypothetical protein